MILLQQKQTFPFPPCIFNNNWYGHPFAACLFKQNLHWYLVYFGEESLKAEFEKCHSLPLRSNLIFPAILHPRQREWSMAAGLVRQLEWQSPAGSALLQLLAKVTGEWRKQQRSLTTCELGPLFGEAPIQDLYSPCILSSNTPQMLYLFAYLSLNLFILV